MNFKKEPKLTADDFRMLIQFVFDKTGLSKENIIIDCKDLSDSKTYKFKICYVIASEKNGKKGDEFVDVHAFEYNFSKSKSLNDLTSSLALATKKYLNNLNGVKDKSKKVNLRKDNLLNIK